MFIRALALMLSLLCAPAFAQVTPGTSPLSIPKGGTGGATAAAARTSLGVTATGADTTYNFRANNLSDVASAPTARSNLGLAIGTNVQAWDNDLDCVAALSTTGLIKRTGVGTCSAGTVALTDLATGTQDTVIGYFGSTTASALAVGNCSNALTYSTSTHTFGCNSTAGTGTVTSVTAGTGLTASPNPIIATGTISISNSMGANKLQVFAAGTSGTVTTPTGAAWVKFSLVGGGGGGGGGGTGSPGTGTAGGNTCINTSGAACTTPVYQAGGGGGGNSSAGTGGAGGTVSGSGSCLQSWPGQNGGAALTGTNGGQSGGGSSLLHGGGQGVLSNSGTANAGSAGVVNSGGGGQGGGATGTGNDGPGGGGGASCVAFIQSPAPSYTYAVSNTAAGGIAGTAGAAGGAGAGGYLIAEFGFN